MKEVLALFRTSTSERNGGNSSFLRALTALHRSFKFLTAKGRRGVSTPAAQNIVRTVLHFHHRWRIVSRSERSVDVRGFEPSVHQQGGQDHVLVLAGHWQRKPEDLHLWCHLLISLVWWRARTSFWFHPRISSPSPGSSAQGFACSGASTTSGSWVGPTPPVGHVKVATRVYRAYTPFPPCG